MLEIQMQDLSKEIAGKYDLNIKAFTQHKDGIILATDKGKKLLKKTSLTGDRILFVHAAKEYLYKNGFSNIDRGLCTTEGEPYITTEGSNYLLCDFIEGSECNFDSRTDITNAARMLAGVHSASKGFSAPDGCTPRDELGKLPVYFVKRLEEIKKLKKVAKKGRTRFDYLFLEYFDYFIKLGENAYDMLLGSKYSEIVDQARGNGVFCHHDYTYHNILLNSVGYWVINFEFCCYEIKVYDVANLLRRKMRKCNWNINEAKIIMDEYRKTESITDDEMLLMKIILQFPQKFWRVVNKYYNSRRSWSEKSFTLKLQEVIDEVEPHKRFMDGFDLLL